MIRYRYKCKGRKDEVRETELTNPKIFLFDKTTFTTETPTPNLLFERIFSVSQSFFRLDSIELGTSHRKGRDPIEINLEGCLK